MRPPLTAHFAHASSSLGERPVSPTRRSASRPFPPTPRLAPRGLIQNPSGGRPLLAGTPLPRCQDPPSFHPSLLPLPSPSCGQRGGNALRIHLPLEHPTYLRDGSTASVKGRFAPFALPLLSPFAPRWGQRAGFHLPSSFPIPLTAPPRKGPLLAPHRSPSSAPLLRNSRASCAPTFLGVEFPTKSLPLHGPHFGPSSNSSSLTPTPQRASWVPRGVEASAHPIRKGGDRRRSRAAWYLRRVSRGEGVHYWFLKGGGWARCQLPERHEKHLRRRVRSLVLWSKRKRR